MSNEAEPVSTGHPLATMTCSPIGWRSVAIWPKPAVNLMNHDNSSKDNHGSEKAARAVCGMLRRNGFGGDRKIFPLETRVEPIFPENAEVSDRHAHGNENTTGANGGSLH